MRSSKISLILCAAFSLLVECWALDLGKPPLVLPQDDRPLFAREAKITPEEYPLAEKVKPLLESGKYSDALNVLNKYEKPKSPALRVLEGQLCLRLRYWKRAELQLNKALQDAPDIVKAHTALATVYQQLEQPLAARKSISTAISLGASDANNFALLAFLNASAGDPFAAVGAYQQALMLDPQNSDIRKGLLFALVGSDNLIAAKGLLKSMLKENPNDSSLWMQRANLAFKMGDESKALSSIETAIRLGENGKAARHMAQQLHLKNQSYARAEVLTLELLNIQQMALTELDALVPWLLTRQKWDMVERLLDATSDSRSQAGSFLRSRFKLHEHKLYLGRGKMAEALSSLEEAIEIDPSNGEALLTLAKNALDQGRRVEAELLYLRAEEVESVSFKAKLGRAQVYIYQEDYREALGLIEELLAQHPDRSDLQENAKIIRNLLQ